MWIIISGRLASGKTTLARRVAPRIGATVVTVSDVMAALSGALGVPNPDRRQLQELGYALSQEGPDTLGHMLASTLGFEADIILDGLRLNDVALWLRERAPDGGLHIVYLDAPTQTRRYRYLQRGDDRVFDQADSHPVEQAVEAMRDSADCVLDAERSVDLIEHEVAELVSGWRNDSTSSGGNS